MSEKTKKQRNYLIDFWKLIFTFDVLLTHLYLDPTLTGIPRLTGLTTNGRFLFSNMTIKGMLTIGIFTFLTGYWLIGDLKKDQRSGLVGKGKNLRLIWNKQAKLIAGYMPYMTFSAIVGALAFFLSAKVPVTQWLQMCFNSFQTFFGIQELGFLANPNVVQAYQAGTTGQISPFTTVDFSCICWYMSTVMCFGGLIYALLIHNESLTMFVIMPIIYIIYKVDDSRMWFYSVANNRNLWDIFRCWGPAFIGMIAWYAVDAIKKHKDNPTLRKTMLVGHILALACFVGWKFFSFNGTSQLEGDVVAMALAFFALAEADPLTEKANVVLNKFGPISKHMAVFSLGIFLFHKIELMTILRIFQDGGLQWLGGLSGNQQVIFMLVFSSLIALIFIPINRLVISKASAFITKITGCRKPIVVDEPSKA